MRVERRYSRPLNVIVNAPTFTFSSSGLTLSTMSGSLSLVIPQPAPQLPAWWVYLSPLASPPPAPQSAPRPPGSPTTPPVSVCRSASVRASASLMWCSRRRWSSRKRAPRWVARYLPLGVRLTSPAAMHASTYTAKLSWLRPARVLSVLCAASPFMGASMSAAASWSVCRTLPPHLRLTPCLKPVSPHPSACGLGVSTYPRPGPPPPHHHRHCQRTS